MSSTAHNRYFDNPVFRLRDTAIVMFNTNLANHEFVIALKQAYQLNLTRIDDLVLDVTTYPCFIYHDSNSCLSYVLLERLTATPANPVFDYYNKMLLIRGRDAREFQQRLYNDLTLPRPEPPVDELLLHHRWELINQFREGVFEPATFNLSGNPDQDQTSLHPGPVRDMPRRLQTLLAKLRQFLTDAFEIFEWHLSNPN